MIVLALNINDFWVPERLVEFVAKNVYNMFQSSYLEKQNENDIYVHVTSDYNKVSWS
jgi:hypothetical protein